MMLTPFGCAHSVRSPPPLWVPTRGEQTECAACADSTSTKRALLLRRRDGDRDGTDLIAAIDDLATFIWTDVAAVALLHDRFPAAGDHRQLAGEHIVDLLRRRGVGTGAAAGQEVRDAEDERLRAAHLGAENAQRLVVAVIGSLIGLRLGELADDHENFSP